MSFDVNLPKSVTPTWPRRCVGCGRDDPESTLRLWTHSIGWWTFAFWMFGKPHKVDVPACFACKLAIRRQRWLRFIVGFAIIMAGVAVGFQLLAAYKGPFKKWLVLLITVGCLLPFILWEVFFPPPVDITAFSETVDYEFRDAGYASEFAQLNRASIKS
jgi:hypothetical protein